MPHIEATARVAVSGDVAFAISQTTGQLRLRWDPFIREQHFLDGATRAAKGVRTRTRSRHGLTMVSQYVSYNPPRNVGMTMREGPWFFETFGGGWRFKDVGEGQCDATWKYTFTVRPSWLKPIADPIGQWLLGRDIRTRITAFAKACEDQQIVEAVTLPVP